MRFSCSILLFKNDNFWSVFGQSWLKTHNRNLKSVFAEFGHLSVAEFGHSPCVITGFFPPSNFGYAPRLAKNCSQRAFLKRRLEPKFRKFWCHDKMAHKISFAIDLITSKWPKITPKTIYTKMAQGEGAILNLSQGKKSIIGKWPNCAILVSRSCVPSSRYPLYMCICVI